MTDEIQTISQSNDGTEELYLDVYADNLIVDGKLVVDFDPASAQLIVATDLDLMVVTANGTTIVIENFVDAVNKGLLEEVLLPSGTLVEAPEFLDHSQALDNLAQVFDAIETASGGEGELATIDAVPESGFARLEVQDFGSSGLEARSVLGQTTRTEGISGPPVPTTSNVVGLDEFADAAGGTLAQAAAVAQDVTASAPSLVLTGRVAGLEDTAIPLDIQANLTDTDGSERLTITVSGIPAGATLSAGTVNPDGSVTLTADQLAGLTIEPPQDSSGDIILTVTATSAESGQGPVAAPLGGEGLAGLEAAAPPAEDPANAGEEEAAQQEQPVDTAAVVETIQITVASVADIPDLITPDASGVEDTAIPLDIQSALNDTDGSETLTITVSDIPAGATLSAGTVNPDGSVTLTEAQLTGLTITPPADSTADFTLAIAATATESGGGSATSNTTLHVEVIGTAAEATLAAPAAGGTEDTAIALSISVTDVESNDTASITVSDIPAGAALSAGTVNPDGSVTLTPAQLSGLTITPPRDSNDDFTLSVAVTTTDNESGDTATVSDTLAVTVTGDADTPTLTVSAASGTEDTAIALDITSALTDTDGSETLTVTVSDIPAGAALSAGTVNPDGSVTLTPAQLSGLTITPPTDNTADFALTVAATATEADGDTATTTTTLGVTVTGTAAEATLGTSAASGTEDTAIALSISVTDVESNDTASVTISDIPAGATLSAGTINPDGSVTLTPAELTGLTITPPADSSDDFTLSVAVTTTDTESGDTTTVNDTLAVSVTGDADAPTLTVNTASGTEDTAIALDITSALTDIDGSETLTVTVSDIPAGATLSDGTVNPDGSVTLTPAQLNGLTITPATDSTADFTLTVAATATEADGDTATTTTTLGVTVTGTAAEATLGTSAASGTEDTAIALSINVTDVESNDTASVTISDIPAGATLSAGTINPDGSVTLAPAQLNGLTITPPSDSSDDFTLSVAVTTTDTESGDTATVNDTLAVSVTGDADTPTLTVSAASGTEDTAIALDITSALTDIDGSETLTVTVSDIPAGATLSAGTVNPDGSVTLTPAQLNGLTITPATDSTADFTLTVAATSTESTGDTATTTTTLGVTVTGTAAEATLGTSAAGGTEDTAIALSISVTGVESNDTASVTVSNIPAGATLSTGTVNPDGSVTLTPAELTGLTITPPSDSSDDFTLSVAVTTTDTESGDTATVTDTLAVSVTGDADAPTLTVNAASGTEDTAIALDITSALTDIDGSETLTVTVSDIPAGAALSAGTVNPDGSVTLTPAQLNGLTITPATDSTADFTLTVAATATEADGDTATTTTTLGVTVTGTAAEATLGTSAASGTEDTAIALSISVTDVESNDTASVTISDIPAGATLSAGTVNPDGSVTLTPAELTGLAITPPSDSDADFTLAVAVTTTDTESGDTATVNGSVAVAIAADADAPTLTVSTGAVSATAAVRRDDRDHPGHQQFQRYIQRLYRDRADAEPGWVIVRSFRVQHCRTQLAARVRCSRIEFRR